MCESNSTWRENKEPATLSAGRLDDQVAVGVLAYDRDVGGLKTLGSLGHVVLHRCSLAQSSKAFSLDRAVMDEHVLTICASDEAKALGIVEPLHGTGFSHPGTPFKKLSALMPR